MVEFLSLFLNLVCCIQRVEVAVDGPVAAVEIRLDGKAIGTLESPPWVIDCDFGEELRPHVLEGVAFDAAGKVMNVAVQHINVPREPAEVRILLERDKTGQAVAARVMYESATASKTRRVLMRMNGLPLSNDDHDRFVLPQHNPDATHILSAEVLFGGFVRAQAQLSFGGQYGTDIRTDLTAVPILSAGSRAPSPESLRGRMKSDAKSCDVVAVEKLGAHVFMVQQAEALHRLSQMARMIDGRGLAGFPRHLLVDEEGLDPNEDTLSIVTTQPDRTTHGVRQLVIFPTIGPLTMKRRSLPWVVTHARVPQPPKTQEHVVDAVASATLSAAATTRPRAVLLVLANDKKDNSLFRAKEIKDYLATMRVPLFVWSVSGETTAGEWGECTDVSSPNELFAAADHLLDAIHRQSIVWIDGHHLPQHIQLTNQSSELGFP